MFRGRAGRWLPVALVILVGVVIVLSGLTPLASSGGPYVGPEDPLVAALLIVGLVGVIVGTAWVWRTSHDDSLDDDARWRYRER